MLDAETLETLLKAQRFQAGAWQKVIDCARQYAQMKTFGTYVDQGHGSVMSVSKSDQQSYLDMFSTNLQRAAVDALREDAFVGEAIATAKS